jgi:hypothetical protein
MVALTTPRPEGRGFRRSPAGVPVSAAAARTGSLPFGSYAASAGKRRHRPMGGRAALSQVRYSLRTCPIAGSSSSASTQASARIAGHLGEKTEPRSSVVPAPSGTVSASRRGRPSCEQTGLRLAALCATPADPHSLMTPSSGATAVAKPAGQRGPCVRRSGGSRGHRQGSALGARKLPWGLRATAASTRWKTASASTASPGAVTKTSGRSWLTRTSGVTTRGLSWCPASTRALITASRAAVAAIRPTLITASGATGSSTPSRMTSPRQSSWIGARWLPGGSASVQREVPHLAHAAEGAQQFRLLFRGRVEAVPVRPPHRLRHASHSIRLSCKHRVGRRERRFLPGLKAGVSTPRTR